MAYRDSEGLVQYLPEIIRKDYTDAQEEEASIKGIGDWAKYRGISSEDLYMIRQQAADEKRSQMAMRNDPDARVGEVKKGYLSYNPEYTTQTVTDNPLEKLGRLKPPGGIETISVPLWDIPYFKDAKYREKRFPIGKQYTKKDTLQFPVGEPEVQAHEYMHRGFGKASRKDSFWDIDLMGGLRKFIKEEIVSGPLGEHFQEFNPWGAIVRPVMSVEHLYIWEKTAPEFFTDKTDKLIAVMDKKERDHYIKQNFSELFPEYKNEEKFAAYRKKIVDKIDQYIEDNPDKVFTEKVHKAYPKKVEKIDNYKAVGKQAGGLIMNYGDYGRSYK